MGSYLIEKQRIRFKKIHCNRCYGSLPFIYFFACVHVLCRSFSSFRLLIELPIYSSVTQIINELLSSSSSSSYSFHFLHLSFNDITIYPNQFTFLFRISFRRVPFTPVRSRTPSLVTFFIFIASIPLQYHISILSKYFHSSFLNVLICERYNAMFQT